VTAPDVDPVWSFLRGLPPKARADLNRSERLVIAIHSAIHTHGWTVEQLVAKCSKNYGGATNLGAIVQFRLDEIDGPPPAAEGTSTHRRVHFGCCDGGWIYPDDGAPVKCPGNRPGDVTA
jgi:hypothetical protein